MVGLSYAFCGCVLVCMVVVFFLAAKYCSVGFEGYPDEWSNKTAEKFYMSFSIAAIISLITSLILFAIAG